MKIIAISGKAESGKNFVAKHIIDGLKEKNKRVVEMAFADYLRFIMVNYLGWDGLKNNVGRTMLQHIGTGVCRKYDKKFFSSKLCELLILFRDEFDFAVITDLRFPDELDDISMIFDVTTIRIDRPGYENHLNGYQNNHISETSMDNFDFSVTITNNDNFETQVDKLVEDLCQM